MADDDEDDRGEDADADDVDDIERVFVLGRRDDAELTPDELARRHGTRRFALWALAVVVIVVAVAITLVALLVDEGSSGPASPRPTSQPLQVDVVHRGGRYLVC